MSTADKFLAIDDRATSSPKAKPKIAAKLGAITRSELKVRPRGLRN
jgi:hypothetical protein